MEKFKDGDILIAKDAYIVLIFKKYCVYDKLFECYFTKGVYQINSCYNVDDFRMTTDEERNNFFKYLKSMNLHWNQQTKTMELIDTELDRYDNFKDGDIVTYKDGSNIVVFKSYDVNDNNKFNIYYDNNRGLFDDIQEYAPFYRLATPEEIQTFYEDLRADGDFWNRSLKKFQAYYPRVPKGNMFFYIDMFCNIKEACDDRGDFSNKCYSLGNYYKDKLPAEYDLKDVKRIFQGHFEEC